VEGTIQKQQGDTTMRFMILVKATKDTEANVTPEAGVEAGKK
jgi:hypothetical protein